MKVRALPSIVAFVTASGMLACGAILDIGPSLPDFPDDGGTADASDASAPLRCPAGSGATVRVADFGATPGDGVDDTAAINAAIATTHAGDTLLFDDGAYNVGGPKSSVLVFKSGVTVIGTGQSELVAAQVDPNAVYDPVITDDGVQNICISGLVFVNHGIHILATGSVVPANITIEGNVFRDMAALDYPWGYALYTSIGPANSHILGNTFQNIADTAIYAGYHLATTEIANNDFDGVATALDLVNIGAGVTITGNTVRRASGDFAIRAQQNDTEPSTAMLVATGNVVLGSSCNENGISFSASSLVGAQVENNTIDMSEAGAPDGGTCHGIGVDVAGSAAMVRANLIRGPLGAGVYNEGTTTTISGNTICGVAMASAIVRSATSTDTETSNTVTTICP